MKKNFLTYLLAICFILPCMFLISACTNDPPPDTQPPEGVTGSLTMEVIPQNEIWLLKADANHHLEEGAGFVEDGNYSIWFADYYNKDTLEILYDGEPISTLTMLETPGYENKNIGLNIRKIATFQIDETATGDHNVTIDVKEEELSIKFVSDGQEFSEEELSTLRDWYFPNNDNRDFASVIDTDFEIKTTYNQITGSIMTESAGIVYECKKPMGYYDEFEFFKPVNSNYITGSVGEENPKDYSQRFLVRPEFNDFTFDTKNI